MNNNLADVDDAIAFLREEHHAVRRLFRSFENLRDDPAKRYDKLFAVQEACSALKIYMRLTEECIYPLMRRDSDRSDAMSPAYVEHLNASALAMEMDALTPGDTDFDTRFSILSNYVDGYIRRELDTLFQQFPQTSINLETLGRTLRARKEELLLDNVSVVGDD